MKVINVMKDGTERESMKGVVIPLDISKVIVEIIMRSEKNKRKEQNDGSKYNQRNEARISQI